MKYNLIVVGGGAAGMMVAITAAENGAEVTLLEPNERLGKKLNITGKGRCNVTNNASQSELLEHVTCNPSFLYSSFGRFDGRDTIDFFESIGVPLKTERGNRVFPVSNRSYDISGALERRMRKLQVRWIRDRARALRTKDGCIAGVLGEKDLYLGQAVVLATGGLSYPATGSTGDGLRMAVGVGHTCIPCRGSLVPLISNDSCCREMQGLALKNIQIEVRNQKKKLVYEDFGELLFTHFGLSGPVILSASTQMKKQGSYTVSIDLKPALEESKLEKRLLRDMKVRQNQNFTGLVGGLVPRSMVPVIIKRCGIDGNIKVNSITKNQRHTLLCVLKKFDITINGLRPIKEAIVTAGGISVKEIDPKSMQSKIVKGLYFAGEIIDVDAFTGGYNLQIAWATGHAAGEAAAKSMRREGYYETF